MLKIPRFVKEFTVYQLQRIDESERTDTEKDILISRASRLLNECMQGFITIEEAMRCLANLSLEIRYGLEGWEKE